MKNFKFIIISSIIIFVICFPAHFIFDFIPNDVVAIFFPTNESIFQHMKMIFTTFLIFYLILFLIKRKLYFENIFLTHLTSSLTCIAFFLVIYIPIYLKFGENMVFTFILLFISIFFGQYMDSFFLTKESYKKANILSIILIIIIYVISGYLTYYPIKSFIFWDPLHKTYEIFIK